MGTTKFQRGELLDGGSVPIEAADHALLSPGRQFLVPGPASRAQVLPMCHFPPLLPVTQSLCVSADPGMPRGTCLSPLSPPLWLCPFPLSLLEAAACLLGDLPHCSGSILASGHLKQLMEGWRN